MRRSRLRTALAAALVATATGALVPPSSPLAAPGIEIGATEDAFKLEPGYAWPVAASLGLDAARITLGWLPGQTAVTPADAALLGGATNGAGGRRVVLAIYGANTSAPQDDAAREAYCTYAANALQINPLISDVIVWNEPNKQAFWRPQFAADGASLAPAAYAALLARCYDVLHAAKPDANVIGLATAPRGLDNPFGSAVISHSVATFVQGMGAWYRASGRAAPLFDTVAHHAYPLASGERPWQRHSGLYLGQGDWDKLMGALEAAFAGTAQALPGQCAGSRCVEIWYTEAGYQTLEDPDKAPLYAGAETDSQALPDEAGGESASPPPVPGSLAPDQATQLVDAIRLAACQDHVGGWFTFLLHDEQSRAGWQSGVFWRDRTPKGSLAPFAAAVAQARAGAVDCNALKGGPEPDAAFAVAADPTAGPHAVVLTDASTAGAATAWRWDVHADGAVEATTSAATLLLPGAGVYQVRLLVRNGVGEDSIMRLVGVPAAGAPGPCASESSASRPVEARYGRLALPDGRSVPVLRLSEAVPQAVASRLGSLTADLAFAGELAAATSGAHPVEWAVAPDEHADAAGALLAGFGAATAGLAGTLVVAPPAPAVGDTLELGWTAAALGDGTTACVRRLATLTLARQDATLVPPPPVATLGVVTVDRSRRAPIVRATVACAGYPSQRCRGTLRLDYLDGGTAARLGRTAFALAGGAVGDLSVRLGKDGLRRLGVARVLRGVRVSIEPLEGEARRTARVRLVAAARTRPANVRRRARYPRR